MHLHSDYYSQRISNKNLSDFLNIYNDAFGHDVSLYSQKNKFDTLSFSGLSDLGFIAYDKMSEPAAYYGVYPMFASIAGQKVLICQSGDTMTKSSHGGRGLFISLAQETYDLCKENFVSGVFGFPSKSSYPGFKKKLNWTFNEFIKRYSFFIPSLPFSFLSVKVPFTQPAYRLWVKLIVSFYKKGDYFKGSIYNNLQDGLLRDEDFWQYKMNSQSNFVIKVADVDVVIKFNGKLSIGDVDLKKDSNLKSLLWKLKVLAFLTFNTHLVFYISPDTLLDQKLSSISEPSSALPIGFLNFNDQHDLSSLKFTYFDFDTF